jgi:hypothetical protein
VNRFEYRRGGNIVKAAVFALMGFFALKWGFADHRLLMIGFGLLLVAGACGAALAASQSAPAIEFDRSQLTIRKALGVTNVPWREVQDIGVIIYTQRYMLVPVHRTRILQIKCDGGMFGTKRIGLAINSIQLPPGGHVALLTILHAAWVGAVGETGVAMAGAGAHGWGIGKQERPGPPLAPVDLKPEAEAADAASGFDPDAANARYLAGKQAEAEGAAPVPVSPFASAPRPVFGRRQL